MTKIETKRYPETKREGKRKRKKGKERNREETKTGLGRWSEKEGEGDAIQFQSFSKRYEMKRIFRTTCAFAILRRCGATGSFIITGRLKTEIERGGTKLVTITLACGTERCNERFHRGNKGGTELRFRSFAEGKRENTYARAR